MLKLFKKNMSNALKKDYFYEKDLPIIKYNKQLKYLYEEKKAYYSKKHYNHIINNDLCCICHICKGCGWITNNNINNGLNFGYEKCYLCNGTGFH